MRIGFVRGLVAVAAICALGVPRASAHAGTGIVVDQRRQVVYFTDSLRSCVWRIDGAGKLTCFASGKHGNNLILDAAGNLYIQNVNATLWKINPEGKQTLLFPEGGGLSQRLTGGQVGNLDELLALDREGNMYFARGNDFRGRQPEVRMRTPDGRATLLAGGSSPGHADGKGNEAKFTSITSAAWGPDGALYVTDAASVRRIAPDGAVSTLAGGPEPGYADDPAGQAKLGSLLGLAVDAAGNVFVADRTNQCVRKITPQGHVSTILRSQDIWTPAAVAVEGNDLYVLERKFLATTADLQTLHDSPRVVKLSSGGKFTVLTVVPGARLSSLAAIALGLVAAVVLGLRYARQAYRRRRVEAASARPTPPPAASSSSS